VSGQRTQQLSHTTLGLRCTRRVLVTGAAGFIGQHVCRALVTRGSHTRALVRNSARGVVTGAQPFVTADVTDRTALRAALRGVDAVVHLAAYAHDARSRDATSEYRRVNVDGTAALLDEAIHAGVRRFIFVSSVKAVGESTPRDITWTESVEPTPSTDYGATKLAAEQLVRDAVLTNGLSAAVLRLPLVYGPGMRANMLRLFQLVDRRVPLPFGGIRNCRSLIFAGNVTAAIEKLLAADLSGCETFFVNDGRDLSTPELIHAIGRALRRRPLLLPVHERLINATARAGDALARVTPWPFTSAAAARLLGSLRVDSTRIQRLVGYSPVFTIEEGMAATAGWFRNRHAASV
jgi:nucleoside-diphosphate-sugar epimerase